MNEYDVNIDFDEASKLWRQNKISNNQGFFEYVCGAICKNGEKCKRKTECGKKCHLHKKQNKFYK